MRDPKTVAVRVVAMALLLAVGTTYAQILSHDQALEDARYLIDAIDQTHPDPYSATGGRIEFWQHAEALLNTIPDGGMSVPDLYFHLRPLVSNLADLHTHLAAPKLPDREAEERYLPIRFKLAYDGIFVSKTKAGYGELRGCRIISVDGVPLEELLTRMRVISPAENKFGTMERLSIQLRYLSKVSEILPETTGKLAFAFDTTGGEWREILVEMLPEGEYNALDWSIEVDRADVSTDGMVASQFLDADKRIGYLWYAAAMTREAFQIGRANQSTAIDGFLTTTYKNYMDAEMPDDTGRAIELLPSLTDSTVDLLRQMRNHDSTHLVIDLRKNGGGWTASVTPLLYLLYGDRYFATPSPELWAYRISQRYLDKFSTTLEEYNKSRGMNLRVGEYYFRSSKSEQIDPVRNRDEYLEWLREKEIEFVRLLEPVNGKAGFSGQVIVLVSPQTSSAAFHLMTFLWYLGATVVGVPPAQAGNAFMDIISTKLPNSRLKLDIASSAVKMFPDDPNMGRTFRPQYPMNWSDFERYGFDKNAEILYTRDLIESGQLN